jgi:hypothetical protein
MGVESGIGKPRIEQWLCSTYIVSNCTFEWGFLGIKKNRFNWSGADTDFFTKNPHLIFERTYINILCKSLISNHPGLFRFLEVDWMPRVAHSRDAYCNQST